MTNTSARDRTSYAALEDAVRASFIAGLLRAVQQQAARGWAQSKVSALLRSAEAAHARHGAAAALRVAGIALIAFAATHLALLTLVPPQVAPGLPRAAWVVVAAAGLVLALVPADLVTAWHARRARSTQNTPL